MAPLRFVLFLLFSLSASSTLRSPRHPTTTSHPPLHLLRVSSNRSTTRFHHHHHHHRPLPLSPGSDYTLPLSVGQPPLTQTIPVYLDTASDLVWLPCSPFECILCENKPPSLSHFDPKHSPSLPVPCDSPACSAAHSRTPSRDLCAAAGCSLDDLETCSCSQHCPTFYYAYADGSLLASLLSDRLPLSPHHSFVFGCARSTLAEPIGVAGLGQGPLSLPAQLPPSPSRSFSYCLPVQHAVGNAQGAGRPGPLILGRSPPVQGFAYTPMLHNPRRPYFYYVGLDAVHVGQRRIAAPPELRRLDRKGGGGLVVDSGSTFTVLPPGFRRKIVSEFERGVGFERAKWVEDETGMGPCYYMRTATKDVEERSRFNKIGALWIPKVGFQFKGNVTLDLPTDNYFMRFDVRGRERVGCLLLLGGSQEERGGPAGILGNYQQQNFEVVYDTEGKRLGFAPRQCTDLWDDLHA
ncbi:hypothetical protein AMTRI_Chr03g147080 [Amborella trichopoda]